MSFYELNVKPEDSLISVHEDLVITWLKCLGWSEGSVPGHWVHEAAPGDVMTIEAAVMLTMAVQIKRANIS